MATDAVRIRFAGLSPEQVRAVRKLAREEGGAITTARATAQKNRVTTATFDRFSWSESSRAAYRFRSSLPKEIAALEDFAIA